MKKTLIIAILLFFVSVTISILLYGNKTGLNVSENNSYLDEYKNIDGFSIKNLNRYIIFKNNNKYISNENIVNYVNIGLDYSFYSFVTNAKLDCNINILVNKYNKLSKEYIPGDLEEINSDYFINNNPNARMLVKEAKEAFEQLSSDSIANDTPVYGQSAYRDYSYQEKLYNSNVESYGKDGADKDTARPGFSEHQTGLSIDVSSTKGGNMLNFGETKSFRWMMNNAYKYGFILRYPKNKENITGYTYESWHFRYVGFATAKDMHDNYPNLTYDEYFYKYIEKRD